MRSSYSNDLFKGFEGQEGELIPILQQVQKKTGYISQESVAEISRFLHISENRIFGVATFYSQFRYNKPARHAIRICLGTACHVRGGQALSDEIERVLGISAGESTPDDRFDFQRVACLGCCALGPVVQINEDVYSKVTSSRLRKILDHYE